MPMMDHDERHSGAFRPQPLAPQSGSVTGAWSAIGGLLLCLCLAGVVCGGGEAEGADDSEAQADGSADADTGSADGDTAP